MGSYKEYDQETLEKLHQVELEILDKFDRICTKHNLAYSLCGGTLLGAVRHKGFIPWDDDIDVIMPRKDYEFFLKIAQKELGNKYYLDAFELNPDYYLPFAKIRKNGTIFDDECSHHLNNHKGIFIDVFPLDNIYDNYKKSYFYAIIAKNLKNAIDVKTKISKLKNARHKIIVLLLQIFSKKFLMKKLNKICQKNKNNNSKYMACFVGTYPFKAEIIERKDLFPLKKIIFEGKKYNSMNNKEKYLSKIYGDYMKLPPIEKRVNHMPLNIDFGRNKR